MSSSAQRGPLPLPRLHIKRQCILHEALSQKTCKREHASGSVTWRVRGCSSLSCRARNSVKRSSAPSASAACVAASPSDAAAAAAAAAAGAAGTAVCVAAAGGIDGRRWRRCELLLLRVASPCTEMRRSLCLPCQYFSFPEHMLLEQPLAM
jgi:hypothetical protein